jgi:hypothetical protein
MFDCVFDLYERLLQHWQLGFDVSNGRQGDKAERNEEPSGDDHVVQVRLFKGARNIKIPHNRKAGKRRYERRTMRRKGVEAQFCHLLPVIRKPLKMQVLLK